MTCRRETGTTPGPLLASQTRESVISPTCVTLFRGLRSRRSILFPAGGGGGVEGTKKFVYLKSATVFLRDKFCDPLVDGSAKIAGRPESPAVSLSNPRTLSSASCDVLIRCP